MIPTNLLTYFILKVSSKKCNGISSPVFIGKPRAVHAPIKWTSE